MNRWDVIVVGGGPAGLSAALVLGRCRRRVLVVDAGRQRNRHAHAMHSYLSRDGTPPREFRRICIEQLAPYYCVELRAAEVADIERCTEGFEAHVGERRESCRKLLLATGVIDHVPRIEGIERFYGRSVHHCPYCDGWEWRDRAIGVYGKGDAKGAGLALMLKQWTRDVALFTDGPAELSGEVRARLAERGVHVHEDAIARLGGRDDGFLERVELESGEHIARDALFFNTGQHQRSPLAEKLGCDFTDRGGVAVGEHEVTTNVPGVYVAGDASRDVQLVIVAAAEGTKAAFAINKALLAEEGLGEE
jgi:thioredoxin reductase